MEIAISDPATFRPRHRTRVFDVANDGNASSVKCALPVCSMHCSSDTQWMPNTDDSVKAIEDHVGDEIEAWLGKLSGGECPLLEPFSRHATVEWTNGEPQLGSNRLVIAVFELHDKHAAMGKWIAEFLRASTSLDAMANDGVSWMVGVLTVPFASRRQLLAAVSALKQLVVSEQVQVLVLLSTHASSQGQVFACTPSHVSAANGDYEEFCSLDNLVLSAQDSLGRALLGIHCSACFLMQLDSSHKEWPRSVSWIRMMMRCAVTGSRGEIFQTGSQVADLLVLLSTLHHLRDCPAADSRFGAAKKRRLPSQARLGPYGDVLPSVLRRIQSLLSPNLAREMRLVQLDTAYVTSRLAVTEDEVEVHARPLLSSRISLVLLTTDAPGAAERAAARLSDAVVVNMSMRSDVRSHIHAVTVPAACLEGGGRLRKWLSERLAAFTAFDQSFFFVVLSPALCSAAADILDEVKAFQDWLHRRRVASAALGRTPVEPESPAEGAAGSGVASGEAGPRVSQPAGDAAPAVDNPLATGFVGSGGSMLPSGAERQAVAATLPRRCVFGIYFQRLSPGVFNACAERWRAQQALVEDIDLCSLPVVSCVSDDDDAESALPSHHQFPLLLYLLHLAVGENCVSLTSGSTVLYRPLRWILERVYTEVVMMLTGLAKLCRFTLLSPAPIAIKDHCLRYELPAGIGMQHWRSGLVCCDTASVLNADFPFGQSVDGDGGARCRVQTQGQSTCGSSPGASDRRSPVCALEPGQDAEQRPVPAGAALGVPLPGTQLHRDGRDAIGVQCSSQGIAAAAAAAPGKPDCKPECKPECEPECNPGCKSKCAPECKPERKPECTPECTSPVVTGCNAATSNDATPRAVPCEQTRGDDAGQRSVQNIAPTCTSPSSSEVHTSADMTSSTDESPPSSDLPISSNWREVHVRHFTLDWSVDFDHSVVSGFIELCTEPTPGKVVDTHSSSPQKCGCPAGGIPGVDEIKLDCSRLDISGVECLVAAQTPLGAADCDADADGSLRSWTCRSCAGRGPVCVRPMGFAVRERYVSCSKPAGMCCMPRHVRVHYSTSPNGVSLSWVKDCDGRPCVFTRGSNLNHRELLPCQDTPSCSSTWSARVRVPDGCTVVMSGDQIKEAKKADDCTLVYECHMTVPFWCCTLAFAAGCFAETVIAPCSAVDDGLTAVTSSTAVPMSLWSATSQRPLAERILGGPLRRLLHFAEQLLGRYTFHHFHVLVLPRSFGCLGLANPNLVFVSPTLLFDSPHTHIRLAHEISHSWFGLDIGARIWTEEWLSEGFATYCEDRIYTLSQRAAGVDTSELRQLSDIRLRLKLSVLTAELDHTDPTAQVLMPDLVSEDRVVNALSEGKQFHQVHYIKGYLLLCHMAHKIGVERFDAFLLRFTQKNAGGNSTSMEVLELFFDEFAADLLSDNFSADCLVKEWLQTSGMPSCSHLLMADADNHRLTRVVAEVQSLLEMIRNTGPHNKQHHAHNGVTKSADFSCFEVCMLLSQLVQSNIHTLRVCCARHIRAKYQLDRSSAEERHLWCELVVKHRCQGLYDDVARFLREDQGMGVYLYGELILTKQRKAQQLAIDVYHGLSAEMDVDARKSVHSMLEPLL